MSLDYAGDRYGCFTTILSRAVHRDVPFHQGSIRTVNTSVHCTYPVTATQKYTRKTRVSSQVPGCARVVNIVCISLVCIHAHEVGTYVEELDRWKCPLL